MPQHTPVPAQGQTTPPQPPSHHTMPISWAWPSVGDAGLLLWLQLFLTRPGWLGKIESPPLCFCSLGSSETAALGILGHSCRPRKQQGNKENLRAWQQQMLVAQAHGGRGTLHLRRKRLACTGLVPIAVQSADEKCGSFTPQTLLAWGHVLRGRPCSHVQESRGLDAASVVCQPRWACLVRKAN